MYGVPLHLYRYTTDSDTDKRHVKETPHTHFTGKTYKRSRLQHVELYVHRACTPSISLVEFIGMQLTAFNNTCIIMLVPLTVQD